MIKRKAISLYLNESDLEILSQLAAINETSLSAIVRKIIREYIEENQK